MYGVKLVYRYGLARWAKVPVLRSTLEESAPSTSFSVMKSLINQATTDKLRWGCASEIG